MNTNAISIKNFRDGIFSLNTRRFGKIAELMIKRLYGFKDSTSGAYDYFDEVNNKRIEVKFSTVLKKSGETINEENIIDQISESILDVRMLKFDDINTSYFDCNIQQIKRREFDVLYYGCFFADKIMICKINTEDILSCRGYSDFQHRGNEGEGQFHINNDTIDFHLENYLVSWIDYSTLYDTLSN